jgi:hypothetical protein
MTFIFERIAPLAAFMARELGLDRPERRATCGVFAALVRRMRRATPWL